MENSNAFRSLTRIICCGCDVFSDGDYDADNGEVGGCDMMTVLAGWTVLVAVVVGGGFECGACCWCW
jgi:hypothetical protein